MQKVGREGGEREGGHIGGVRERQGLAAALQRCMEGSRGDVGALGKGHWVLHWWVWGCFTPRVHGRPWHPSCAAVSACEENNPPAGRRHPYAVLSTYSPGCPADLRVLQGGQMESLLTWDCGGSGVALLGPCWWYLAHVGLAGLHAHSAPCSRHRIVHCSA